MNKTGLFKALKINNFLLTLIALFLLSPVMAQPSDRQQKDCPQHKYQKNSELCEHLPNLTDEQRNKMQELRISHLKVVQPINNELKLKYAELRILTTAEKADQKAVDKKIDEIYSLKTKKAKMSQAHKQSIRALLTDEQRIIFDSRQGRAGASQKACPHEHGKRHDPPGR